MGTPVQRVFEGTNSILSKIWFASSKDYFDVKNASNWKITNNFTETNKFFSQKEHKKKNFTEGTQIKNIYTI